ncbi:unnamed protein product [Ambrosiozyma monospora]|uniref:Unnamed protein product n=1 Tax=Ambrosiozyma monospora TaxID=43982 RepID=A0ACB5U9V5_AMBMO|nr:unnamed protein product [Ambrosiozyma monospora]
MSKRRVLGKSSLSSAPRQQQTTRTQQQQKQRREQQRQVLDERNLSKPQDRQAKGLKNGAGPKGTAGTTGTKTMTGRDFTTGITSIDTKTTLETNADTQRDTTIIANEFHVKGNAGIVCPICNEQMITLNQLNQHLDDAHGDNYNYDGDDDSTNEIRTRVFNGIWVLLFIRLSQ